MLKRLELLSFLSVFRAATTELWVSVLCNLFSAIISSPETTLVNFWFHSTSFFPIIVLTSLRSKVSVAEWLAQQPAGSNLCRIFHETHEMLACTLYSTLLFLWLYCIYCPMLQVVGSNPANGSFSSTFILSIQIRNYPASLPYHAHIAQLAYHGKKF